MVLFSQKAQAATLYWDINGTTPDSSGGTTASGTWDGVNTFFNDDPAGGAGTLTAVTTAADSVVFSAGSNATGNFTVVVSGTQTVGDLTVEEGNILLGTGTMALAGSGIVNVASGATWDVHGAASGFIGGTVGLTKNGNGTLFLGGSETYSKTGGATILAINAGTVDFSGDTALGVVPTAANSSAVVIDNGATLRFSGTSAVTLNVNRGVRIGGNGGTIEVTSAASTGLSLPSAASFTLNGSGTLTKTGPGRLTFNTTSNSFTGKYRILGGTLNAAGDGRFGLTPTAVVADYFVLDSGALRSAVTTAQSWGVNRGITLGAGGGTIMQPGAGTTTDSLTVNSVIAGTLGGNLTIAATDAAGGGSSDGIVILTAANTYNGNTTINGGMTLRVGAAGVIPDTSVVTMAASGATFDINNLSETVKSISGTAGVVQLGTGVLTVANPNGETYTSVITGSAGSQFIKNGTGTLTLSGSNVNFNGEMLLNAGKLGVGGSNALGSGTAIVTIAGAVTLSNTATTGRSIPAAVSANLNSDFTVDDSLFNTSAPGQILFNGPATIRNSNRTITVNGTANLGFADLREDVAGRTLTKDGPGTLALTGTNTANAFTGDVTVLAGRLQVSGSSIIGTGSNNVILSGGALNSSADRGTLQVTNPINLTASSAITTTSTASGTIAFGFSGPITASAGTLTLRHDGASGTGPFEVRLTGNNDYALPINTVNGVGPVRLAAFNAVGGTQTFSGLITGNGALRRSASTAGTGGDVVVSNSGNTFSGGTVLVDGGLGIAADSVGSVTSGPLGTGTLTISPFNSISANPKIYAVGGARILGNAIAFTSSPLIIGGSNDLSLTGNVDLGTASRTIQVDNIAASNLSGVISGTVGITKTGAGTLTVLNPANTYSGATWLLNGNLNVSNTGNLGDGSATNGLLFNGGTLHNTAPIASANRNVQLDGPGTVVADDSISLGDASGTGSLIKSGTGMLTINSIKANNLTISTGVVKLAANGQAAGVSVLNTTAPGTGQFDINDNHLIDHATGVGTWNGTNYDGLTGMIASGRAGNAWTGPGIITSQSAAAGSNYTSIGLAKASDIFPNTATETGTWAGQTITGSDTLVMYTYGGDANLDGKINIDDYIKIDNGIANNLTGWVNGDFNYDGKVNIDDYTTVIDANIGNQSGVFFASGGLGGGASGVSAVPEPASLSLLGLAATGLLARRRRGRQ